MTTKTNKILFWSATGVIAVFSGLIPLLTFRTELAREGIRHLGYPGYFGSMLVGVRVLGVLALVIPRVPARWKEWAYAGFSFELLSATISHWVVDGFGFQAVLPLVFLGILALSYLSYHKLLTAKS